MKICVISTQIFPLGARGLNGYGGLEQIAWECARGLAARGHSVTLIAPLGSQCPSVDVLQCLPPGFSEEAAYGGCVFKNGNGEDVKWPGYWSKLLEFNDGVIIDHTWNKWSYMLMAEGRFRGVILAPMHAPVNTMYGSLPPVEHPRMVCISEDQKAHFDALHSPRTARVVRNGIDLDFYRSLNVPRTSRFLFLARFSSIKGPDIAIDSCRKVGAGLDLIGDTTITQEPEYYNQCVSLCDGKQLRIIGNIPRGNAVWWYSQAHTMLHPNMRFREPLGLAPLEAQACGTPIIAFDYGAMRETVRHNETGFLVKNQNDFVEAVKQHMQPIPDFVRKRCVEWASEFSIGKMILGYESLCQRALDGEVW